MESMHEGITGRTRVRRRALAVASIGALVLVLTGCLSADQQSDVDLVNAARKSKRLAAVSVDMTAAKKAQAWSDHMAKTGVLEHTGGGTHIDTSGMSHWCSLGENVGKGSSVSAVHDAFMASAPHKAHILGNFDRVGTGVTKVGRVYWVTEIYLRTC